MRITIQQILDQLTAPAPTLEHTVDRLETGDPAAEVTGIGVTFMPTHQVIRNAAGLGINLLITHEGAYYSHHIQTDLLRENEVYSQKQELIEASGIAVFRLHDAIHKYNPDGITAGLVQAMGWEDFVLKFHPASAVLNLPEMTAAEIAEQAKLKLDIPYVRVAGDLSMRCRRAGILVGYRGGGANAIPLFGEENLDVIIAGEGPEWETPEYVRDAVQQGRRKALIMLGHAESEAPGMRALAKRLQALFPTVPVHYLKERPLFQIV
ncbi:Nif3-like dinuclear metal center hexameric protein [Paenibacillus ihumii]|uniref:Nif3-like dinuclear metal center hexameric protein n=1 Tax=Paenibacillus ihumii TaxID=687436 RepID=UPI0006D7AD10|nr:Nif3-like dinuclear metal center hexameric protein [Paenibacillus ihumii]